MPISVKKIPSQLISASILFGVLLAWGSMSFAEDVGAPQTPAAAAPKSGVKKEQRKQTITFEDELVEGATQKPDLFYLFQKKNFNFKRMIKLRNDFIPEMKRSTEDVQRGRAIH